MKYLHTRNWSLVWLAIFMAGCDLTHSTSNTAPPVGSHQQLGVEAAATEPAATEQQVVDSMPDVSLSIVDFAGINERIAQARRKVVVMDAWSTSCPPCMKEFHHLVELHKKYGPQQVACISLSFDYEGIGKPEEQRDRVLDFLRKQGAAFDNLMSNEESDVLYRKLHLAAVPAVFVYDQAGNLRKRFDNEKAKSKTEAFTYEQVGALVAQLLEENSPTALPVTSEFATPSAAGGER